MNDIKKIKLKPWKEKYHVNHVNANQKQKIYSFVNINKIYFNLEGNNRDKEHLFGIVRA